MTSSTHWTLAFMRDAYLAAPGANPPNRGKGDSAASPYIAASVRAASVLLAARSRTLVGGEEMLVATRMQDRGACARCLSR